MAVEDIVIDGMVNGSNGFVDALIALPGVSTVIRIFQVAGILVIAYILFLLVRAILQFRHVRKLSKLQDSVERIEKKLDKVLRKTKK
jgi:hypothetical protein